MKKGHRFQSNYAVNSYGASRDLWDTPIFESESFVALPTVGALVEGWLLVVPKMPILSYAHIHGGLFSEVESFLNNIVPQIESIYGPVAIFEHGPAATQTAVGCGVDYAHLHVVPTRFDLLSGAKSIDPNVQWQEVCGFNAVQNCHDYGNGYWFLQQAYGRSESFIGTPNGKPTSQLFRRVISNYLKIPSRFDWKNSPCESIIAATVESLSVRPVLA